MENSKTKEELIEELAHVKRQLAMTVSLKYHLMPNNYPAFPDLKEKRHLLSSTQDRIGLRLLQ